MIDWAGTVRRLRSRVNAMVNRSVVSIVNDAMKTQRLQLVILSDETVDDVEHMQPYGLSFVPPNGSEAVALAVRGDRDHTIALCVQNPDERPTGNLARTGGLYTNGEWRVFIDQQGKLHLGAQQGAEPAAMAESTQRELADIRQKFDAFLAEYKGHMHPYAATTVAATTSPAVSTIQPMGAPGSVAAQHVRVT
jgi:phage baseplate assembly protein V